MKHDLLKLEVERIIGHRLTSANEFEQLSHLLLSHTHERLSPTTLKRLWGYLKNEEVETRRHTLDVLSRFVGFGCYEDFCAHLERLEEQHCRGEHHAGLTSDNDPIFNLEYFVCLYLLIYAQ